LNRLRGRLLVVWRGEYLTTKLFDLVIIQFKGYKCKEIAYKLRDRTLSIRFILTLSDIIFENFLKINGLGNQLPDYSPFVGLISLFFEAFLPNIIPGL